MNPDLKTNTQLPLANLAEQPQKVSKPKRRLRPLAATDFSEEDQKRFWSNVKRGTPEECWEWQKSKCKRGYGRIMVSGTRNPVHRVAAALCFGSIPAHLLVCHHCDNPPCCNPAHLFLGTDWDNKRDCILKGRAFSDGGFRNNPEVLKRALKILEENPELRSKETRGEKNRHAKLTESEVYKIVELAKSGTPLERLVSDFALHEASIRNILRGRTWKHLKIPPLPPFFISYLRKGSGSRGGICKQEVSWMEATSSYEGPNTFDQCPAAEPPTTQTRLNGAT